MHISFAVFVVDQSEFLGLGGLSAIDRWTRANVNALQGLGTIGEWQDGRTESAISTAGGERLVQSSGHLLCDGRLATTAPTTATSMSGISGQSIVSCVGHR